MTNQMKDRLERLESVDVSVHEENGHSEIDTSEPAESSRMTTAGTPTSTPPQQGGRAMTMVNEELAELQDRLEQEELVEIDRQRQEEEARRRERATMD